MLWSLGKVWSLLNNPDGPSICPDFFHSWLKQKQVYYLMGKKQALRTGCPQKMHSPTMGVNNSIRIYQEDLLQNLSECWTFFHPLFLTKRKMLPVLLVLTKHDYGQLTVFISVVLNVSCQRFLTTHKSAVEFNFLQQEMKSIIHSPDPGDAKLLGLHSFWVVGSG